MRQLAVGAAYCADRGLDVKPRSVITPRAQPPSRDTLAKQMPGYLLIATEQQVDHAAPPRFAFAKAEKSLERGIYVGNGAPGSPGVE